MNQIGVVPWVSILIVCACPVVLTTLPFTILVTLDSFLIAFSLFLQLQFYAYAKHGKYGHYARHPPDGSEFHISGGKVTTAFLVTMPILVVFTLIIAQGWQILVLFSII